VTRAAGGAVPAAGDAWSGGAGARLLTRAPRTARSRSGRAAPRSVSAPALGVVGGRRRVGGTERGSGRWTGAAIAVSGGCRAGSRRVDRRRGHRRRRRRTAAAAARVVREAADRVVPVRKTTRARLLGSSTRGLVVTRAGVATW